jgi:proteasome lid subunit RPN8/RPN11
MNIGDIGKEQPGTTRTRGAKKESVLRLPRAVYRDLRAHGEETWPHECCGALLGRAMQGGGPEVCTNGCEVDSMVRAINIRADLSAGASRDRYEIAPAELVRIAEEAHSRGLEIAGFYHSHPDHPAQPSSTDLAEAHWLGCSYVITEVAQGKAALTKAFLLRGTAEEDKHFEPQTIQIVEPRSDSRRFPK